MRKVVKFWLDDATFNQQKQVKDFVITQTHDKMNIVLVTYDSCRYDTLIQARTPNLDKYGHIYSGWTSATFTYPAHAAFFMGILPMVNEALPYLNRFHTQLINLNQTGQAAEHTYGRRTLRLKAGNQDMIYGLRQSGYYTVGSGSALWFDKKNLIGNFNHFQFKHAQSAPKQINYVLEKIGKYSKDKPFFAFMNFIETHTPYMHYGSDRAEFAMGARGFMRFPPQEDPIFKDSHGGKLHTAQIKAAEHLDIQMGDFLKQLPGNTLVIVTADHGEAFGEDGFWGHGVYHPTVMNVPMMCFMINHEPILDERR